MAQKAQWTGWRPGHGWASTAGAAGRKVQGCFDDDDAGGRQSKRHWTLPMELRPVMRYMEASYKCPYVYYARCRQVGLYEAVEGVFVDASTRRETRMRLPHSWCLTNRVFDVPRLCPLRGSSPPAYGRESVSIHVHSVCGWWKGRADTQRRRMGEKGRSRKQEGAARDPSRSTSTQHQHSPRTLPSSQPRPCPLQADFSKQEEAASGEGCAPVEATWTGGKEGGGGGGGWREGGRGGGGGLLV